MGAEKVHPMTSNQQDAFCVDDAVTCLSIEGISSLRILHDVNAELLSAVYQIRAVLGKISCCPTCDKLSVTQFQNKGGGFLRHQQYITAFST